MDMEKAQRAVRLLLEALGEDPDREGLRDTPARVARMYEEMFAGLRESVEPHFQALFHQRYDEIIMVRDIPFHSFCEHHLLPFIGTAHVAYIPDGRILGLSKFARIVDHFARRPQVQERLTRQIADSIVEHLAPLGVAVVMRAAHTCMTLRGARKTGSEMVTSALEGVFRTDGAARGEVLALMGHGLGCGG